MGYFKEISVNHDLSGVPLASISHLQRALQCFAGLTFQNPTKLGIDGLPNHQQPLALALSLHSLDDADDQIGEITKQLTADAIKDLRFNDRWHKDAGYEINFDHRSFSTPPGSRFHKSRFFVEKAQNGILLLNVNKEGDTDTVEDEIAYDLHLERGLKKIDINLQLEPKDDKFDIDLTTLAERLNAFIKTLPNPDNRIHFTGATLAQTLTSIDALGKTLTLKLCEINGIEVDVGFDYIMRGRRHDDFGYDLWQVEKSTVQGPLTMNFDNTAFLQPSIAIEVRPVDKQFPVIDWKMKDNMKQITARLITALNPIKTNPLIN